MMKFIIAVALFFSLPSLAAMEAIQDSNGNIIIKITEDSDMGVNERIYLVTQVFQIASHEVRNGTEPVRLERILHIPEAVHRENQVVLYQAPIPQNIVRGVMNLFSDYVYKELLRLLNYRD